MKKHKTLMVAINAKYVHTNIAVRYISEYSRQKRFECDFSEFSINEPEFNVLSKLYASDCDAYGFSCYIWNISYVLKISKSLKKLRPERKIFLGGPEVSFDAEKILGENDFIDYIVKGEGEDAVLSLLENPPKERTVISSSAQLDMDSLPFPYADKDLENVVNGEKLVYYETSRGCPFSCTYCLSSVEKGVRFLSIGRVEKELSKFIESRVMTVKFVDRTFNADRKRAHEIWEYCINNGKDTCFHFEIGADLLEDCDIELLKNAHVGQIQFEIGVQTTNPDTLIEISRSMDIEKLSRNVKRLRQETNVMLHLDLIAGLPLEDFDSFKKSFNEVYNLNPHVLQLGFLKLLKGSALRTKAKEYGIEFSDFAPYEVFSTNVLSFDEIMVLKAVEDVLERYYNSGRFYKTLGKAVEYFETPFDFYLKLSKYWKEKGLLGQGVKRISLYSHLYEFLKGNLAEEKLAPIMRVMKEDFSTWHSNGVGTPDWYKLY